MLKIAKSNNNWRESWVNTQKSRQKVEKSVKLSTKKVEHLRELSDRFLDSNFARFLNKVELQNFGKTWKTFRKWPKWSKSCEKKDRKVTERAIKQPKHGINSEKTLKIVKR